MDTVAHRQGCNDVIGTFMLHSLPQRTINNLVNKYLKLSTETVRLRQSIFAQFSKCICAIKPYIQFQFDTEWVVSVGWWRIAFLTSSIIIPLRLYLFSNSASVFKNIVTWNDRNCCFLFLWEFVLVRSPLDCLHSPRLLVLRDFVNYS